MSVRQRFEPWRKISTARFTDSRLSWWRSKHYWITVTLELQEKGSEISALREEIAQSEFARRQTEMLAATQAEQIRERVKIEVGVLDTQLKEKENALKVVADRARELESVFNARIADLQTATR